jgi:site-specific DNA-methyltransferase (adenine-specific)
LFGSQPFTTHLIASNLKLFRYEWVWNKGYSTNFQLVKKQPSKIHENICVFYKKRGTYNYQKTMRDKPKDYSNCKKEINTEKGFEHFSSKENQTTVLRVDKYPTSILNFNGQNKECNNKNRIHANQKPLDLFEYLINTYTNPGELVLDNCAGSFTTAEAAINTNRKYVCIESEEKYYNLGQERIKNALDKKSQKDTLLVSQQHQNE